MGRLLAFLYGVIAYAFFFGTILYAIIFVGNIGADTIKDLKTIDLGKAGPVGEAILINVLLLAAFTAACKGKVTACHLGGCNVGSAPHGSAFLQKLADDGDMTATAWDGVKSTDGKIWYIYSGTTLVTKTDTP